MKIRLIAFCMISLMACQQNKMGTISSSADTTIKNSIYVAKLGNKHAAPFVTTKPVNEPYQTNAKKLLGVWVEKNSKTSNANFVLRESSIYYPDTDATYPYKLVGDSILVNYDDDYVLHMHFEIKGNDTLTLISEDGPNIYYRVKK